jgi:hypothetical protein
LNVSDKPWAMAGSRLRHDLHQPPILLFGVLTENMSTR